MRAFCACAHPQVNESMKSCQLPAELQHSVRQFYLYSWARHKAANSTSYFTDLSPGLRSKIALFLYHDMLVTVPLFTALPRALPSLAHVPRTRPISL